MHPEFAIQSNRIERRVLAKMKQAAIEAQQSHAAWQKDRDEKYDNIVKLITEFTYKEGVGLSELMDMLAQDVIARSQQTL